MRHVLLWLAALLPVAACSAAGAPPSDTGVGDGRGGAGGAQFTDQGEGGESGSAGAGGGGAPVAPACNTGGGKVCACDDGQKGLAICLPDQSGYGECKCSGPGKGGAGGATGNGGSPGGNGGSPGAAGSGFGPACASAPTPATPGNGSGCAYTQSVPGDACGAECGTGPHAYYCNDGSGPPPSAGKCLVVGEYSNGRLVCCEQKACAFGTKCPDGRDYFACPSGVAPPAADCEAYPGAATSFCCGKPSGGKCADSHEPNDTKDAATSIAGPVSADALVAGGVDWFKKEDTYPNKTRRVGASATVQPSFYLEQIEVCVGATCVGGGGQTACTTGALTKVDGLEMCCQVGAAPAGTKGFAFAEVTCPSNLDTRTIYARSRNPTSVCVDSTIVLAGYDVP